jgi:hypothetical protein
MELLMKRQEASTELAELVRSHYGDAAQIDLRIFGNVLPLIDSADSICPAWIRYKQFLEEAAEDAAFESKRVKSEGDISVVPDDIQARRLFEEIVMEHASMRADVRTFRTDMLRGGLLKFPEVSGWINAQAEADGPPTVRYQFKLPSGHRLIRGIPSPDAIGSNLPYITFEPPVVIDDKLPVAPVEQDFLEYAAAGMDGVSRKPFSDIGVLGRLHQVSTALARRYGWQKALATTFILTAITPSLPSITSSIRYSVAFRSASPARRIVLDIDASARPEDVAKIYREIRSDLKLRWHRPWTAKGLQLARFYMNKQGGQTWEELRLKWNGQYQEEHQEWTYKHMPNFNRDCRAAWSRLQAVID